MEEKEKQKVPEMCYWYDQCKCTHICKFYTNLKENDDIDDDDVNKFIVQDKMNFKDKFYQKLSEEDYWEE